MRRLADDVCTLLHHVLQEDALVEARAANQEILTRPFPRSFCPHASRSHSRF